MNQREDIKREINWLEGALDLMAKNGLNRDNSIRFKVLDNKVMYYSKMFISDTPQQFLIEIPITLIHPDKLVKIFLNNKRLEKLKKDLKLDEYIEVSLYGINDGRENIYSDVWGFSLEGKFKLITFKLIDIIKIKEKKSTKLFGDIKIF